MSDAVSAPPPATLDRLRASIEGLGSVLVAYSGGIDSALVFKVAHDVLEAGAMAVTAVSPTFPAIELDVARRVAQEIGGRHRVIDTDQLMLPAFTRNDASRCYHCKTDLYRALERIRRESGLAAVADGTNLDDLDDDRPGITAAREWGVRSPLVEAGCSKDDVRALARLLGLSIWDKPAAACLSSRIPRGITITRASLSRVERAERVLFDAGFRQVRVRDHGDSARIEVGRDELASLLATEVRERIVAGVQLAGFRFVTVDLDGYRAGSTNRTGNGKREAGDG